jgi:ABC-type transport system substrate-binding protein
LTELPSVQGSDFEVDTRPVENQYLWFPLCKSRPPFDDVRVRQALNFALDRDAINERLLYGEGEPMWMLWPKISAYYVDDLEGHYAYDPERARELLAEAGYADGLSLELMPFPGNPLIQQMAEVAQAQWKEVGVDVELVPSANAVNDFYVETRYPAAVLSSTRGGILKVSGPFRPGSIGNVCRYDNPELNRIIDRLAAAADGSPEATDAWAEAQRLVVQESLALWANFIPAVHAWDGDKVGGVDFVLNSGAVGLSPLFTEMYVRA